MSDFSDVLVAETDTGRQYANAQEAGQAVHQGRAVTIGALTMRPTGDGEFSVLLAGRCERMTLDQLETALGRVSRRRRPERIDPREVARRAGRAAAAQAPPMSPETARKIRVIMRSVLPSHGEETGR